MPQQVVEQPEKVSIMHEVAPLSHGITARQSASQALTKLWLRLLKVLTHSPI